MSNCLWQPSNEQIKSSNMYRFMQAVNAQTGQKFENYESLYQWSIQNIPDFWSLIWEFTGIIASQPYDRIVDDASKMPFADWFSGARLNFSENLLRYRDDHIALIFKGEGQAVRRMTYAQLYREVAHCAQALRALGLKPGDRVVGFMPNMPETIIAMLAAVSLGAVWSSCSPDFGVKGVLDRFGQVQPKVLFTCDGYFFKGRSIDSLERITTIIKDLKALEKVIVVPYTREKADITNIPNAIHYPDFITGGQGVEEVVFEQLPFNHPLYIMYSSGTTGLPKCMVQSAGGILIHHLKELILHTNLTRDDRIFYFTTCGWMMWNWLTSSLGVGATLVLFDGNPFHPDPMTLWELAQNEKITVFGTSAGYIAALKKTGAIPGKAHDLSSLRALLSTGSPLPPEDFEYIYTTVKKDLQLASISGGSDLNGCFALGNPMGPVYSGELQCRGLGMKVEAFDAQGTPVINQKGELVCRAAFPSMPIYFWDDPDGRKYHAAYFEKYPNTWTHGDFIQITDKGGVIIYGRSDATLNPGGVRIGTADIYREIERIPAIEDSVAVGQHYKNDVRIILFVKLNKGYDLTDELRQQIKTAIRANISPRHVPAKILAVPDIPYTHNMKKVELAVRKVIHNEPVKNKDSLRNPESLDAFTRFAELMED